jgi:phosphoribosylglycinamide formyltransferase-1/phosphoribosylamine--glycine ligase/phosphoribosylglycinamide formyltransferase/phosphoribosylformylglycinamidine cyclo-ligase
MSPDPEAELERLRAICFALPHAAEKLSHGQPAFYIEKGTIFAWFWHNHHSDGRTAVMVKTSGIEEQEMLIEADPELYYRPAYLGPFGWVAIRTDLPDTDWDHIADRIAMSWDLIAPPKLKERR